MVEAEGSEVTRDPCHLGGCHNEFHPGEEGEGRGRNRTGGLPPAPPGPASRTAAGQPPHSDSLSAGPVAATVLPLCPISLTVGSS